MQGICLYLSQTPTLTISGKLREQGKERTTGGKKKKSARKEKGQTSRNLALLDPHFLQDPHHYICSLPVMGERNNK